MYSSFTNRLRGQPESYERKSKYTFLKTLGAGTFGIVREVSYQDNLGKTLRGAVKIILKKNLKGVQGGEQSVMHELDMLQRMHHPRIVKFVDWFESRDKYYIVTELATGGELFHRICDLGSFNEKDAAETMRQVLDAVDYLHSRNVVHRDLKPENLLYRTKEEDDLVLADFGIAKMLDNTGEALTTICGSFGYAAPEVMLQRPHGKAVDMWSLGIITYTLLCGYSPFSSQTVNELVEECQQEQAVVFHDRYWRNISNEAKDFIRKLLRVDADKRWTSKQALGHVWLTGKTAGEGNLVPNLRESYLAKDKLRRAIERVQLANRIENLKAQEEDPANSDIPENYNDDEQLGQAVGQTPGKKPARNLTRKMKGAIFREIVLAKVREMKAQENAAQN